MNPRRALLALLAVILSCLAAPPPSAGQNTGAAEYVRGLEALEAGAYTSAAGSFTRAIQGDGDTIFSLGTGTWSGDPNYANAAGNPVSFIITPATTLTTLLSSTNPSIIGRISGE